MTSEDQMRVVLQDTVEVLEPQADEVYLLQNVDDSLYVIDDADDAVLHLLDLLRKPQHIPTVAREVAAAHPTASASDLIEVVNMLCEHHLVVPVADAAACLTAHDRLRYDRQLAYLSAIAPPGRSGDELQHTLREARVAVLGLGGIGSWTAYALASLGVGVIRAVDADIVEASNLNRQILYGPGDIGTPKVVAAERTIRAFDPGVAFEPCHRMLASVADVAEVVVDADFVVAAVDEPVHEIGRWINAACFGSGVPFISVSQVPPLVRVGPTYLPGVTACHACHERWISEQFELYDELVSQRRRVRPSFTALGTCSGVIGATVASEIMHHLTGGVTPATVGQAWILNMQTLQTELQPVQVVGRCEMCSVHDAGVTSRPATRGASG